MRYRGYAYAWKQKRRGGKKEQAEQENLRQALLDCMQALRHNEMVFQLETEPELIERCIYERIALQAHYRYLMRCARSGHIRMVLGTKARHAPEGFSL